MIKENQRILNVIQVVLDGIVIFLSLIFAWLIRFSTGLFEIEEHLTLISYLKILILIVPLYLGLFSFFKLYISYRKRDLFTEIGNIIKSNILGIVILTTFLFLIKQVNYSRYVLLIFSILSVGLTSLERILIRLILRTFRSKGYNLKHILVLGADELAVDFLRKVQDNKQLGYNVLAILDDKKKIGYKIKGAEVSGRLVDLDRFLTEQIIDEVIVAISLDEYDNLKDIINTCEKNGVRTQIIPAYYKYIPAKPYIDEIDGLQLINIRHVPLDNIINSCVKRIMDISVSFVALIIFSPIMLFTAIMIKITSPGPIIFKQERVGLNGRCFNMYKFRSMHVAKEEIAATKWTTKDDPRKTKFGSFIRKISIDELPQLFNVLKGDMSLVGPRPERPFFVDKFKEEIPKYMIKHQVRPGITGWAQVNGWRGDTSIKKRIECDIYYIENWTLFFDIKILWLTVFKGFRNKNAY